MKRRFRVAAAAALVVSIGAVFAPTSASAGEIGGIRVMYEVNGPSGDDVTVADAIDPELYDVGGLIPVDDTIDDRCASSSAGANKILHCGSSGGSPIADGVYTIGLNSLDPGYYVDSVSCTNFGGGQPEVFDTADFPAAEITYQAGDDWDCTVRIFQNPLAYFDVEVDNGAGGSAVFSDFDIEIYEVDGGEIAETLTDPSAASCFPFSRNETDCANIRLAPGGYYLGATNVLGYTATSVGCVNDGPLEQFPSGQGFFTQPTYPATKACRITMTYVTQIVTADIVVENDSGGTAVGSDFTIEIFQDGSMVASGVDPAPNDPATSFVSDPLPIGAYTFGVSGPDGYETTVDIQIEEVDVIDGEQLPSPAADFTLTDTQTISAVLTANDPLQTTTTTTTTTTSTTTTTTTTTSLPPTSTAAPATDAPTTAATTTTIRPTNQLPSTGSAPSTVLLWALALLALGSGTILITRRS